MVALLISKELITFSIAIFGFFMSLYNFSSDRRKIKLSYILVPHDESGRFIFCGIISNPSKSPNSVINYSFFNGCDQIKTARYKTDGFDIGGFFMPSNLGPLEIATPIPSGGTLFFKSVLISDISLNKKITLKIKTANYSKSFKVKIKSEF